ncbi:MAG TPA: bifunctional DNA-formamidopyrimidine glycosylase/DNA-(apurinic or apyrimidinic site) lyase [Polyangiaceae bacterium]|nr:bifunctional DNA-formamidopyrimidine glycosylase/DNA-(apurinic or apyrimidinic site) lyase [Polyangiaceae bacterium]
MPELPEVEFARSCLSRWLRGRTLRQVEADPTRVIRGAPPREFAALAQDRVTKVERRGKWLLWRFESEVGLLAHLGMTGKFEIARPGAPSVRWSRVRFTRSDGAVVHYRDPRQFGHIRLAPLSVLLASEPLKSLGPDAKDHPPSTRELSARLGKSRRKVKEVLMDQTVLAGLGNIQVTEALFMARVHPARRADSLTPAEVNRTRLAIAKSLARTLAMNRGDKITYVEESKRVENPFLVYGKANSPCPRCRVALKKMVIGGRTSAFCPSCQLRTVGARQGRGRRSA